MQDLELGATPDSSASYWFLGQDSNRYGGVCGGYGRIEECGWIVVYLWGGGFKVDDEAPGKKTSTGPGRGGGETKRF